MEDDPDMDIEETTLMYPRIESIYSDVNIKTEPIDIDEDEYESVNLTESSNDYYMPIPNKIILGSKPPSTQVEPGPTAGPSTASDTWEEDAEDFLECGECNLLFPTRNELDSHKMSSHSFLVARPVSKAIKREWEAPSSSTFSPIYKEIIQEKKITVKKQKAMKSTSKSALNHTFPAMQKSKGLNKNPYVDLNNETERTEAMDQIDRFLCKHCDVRFPDEIALIKHTYELLPERAEVNSPSDAQKLYQCLYCSLYLMNPGPMKRHLLTYHKVLEFAVKQTNYKAKCTFCNSQLTNYRQYNKHLVNCHRKELHSKTLVRHEVTPMRMKCTICNQIFPSRYTAYKHKASKHPGTSKKQTFLPIYEKPSKLAPPYPRTQKVTAKVATKAKNANAFVPMKALFKCNKCQIHFVSSSAALVHSKRCTLAKGDWKCSKCRRTFTKADIGMHLLQHHYSEKFKVHKVSDKINSKVLCLCPKCHVCFDDVSMKEHMASSCDPGNSVECKSCNLKIYSKSFTKHKLGHSKYNFASNDFVVVTYIDPSLSQPVNVSKPSVTVDALGEAEEPAKSDGQVLFVCSLCKCHSLGSKHRFYHLEGKCTSLERRCCPLCGLGFSTKPFTAHLKVHRENANFNLDDITFKTLQDSTVINPYMPEFYQCRKCHVRFVSPKLKKKHNCSTQIFLKCDQCLQKFDSATYDVHLAYHNYRGRKAVKPPTAQLIFYSCAACKYGFNSYDGVVEHCQKHYTNSEVQATQKCKMCKLDYAEDHQHLHAGRKTFDVFQFDHEKLLTDDWLDGFESLSKDKVEDVLSKSVYGSLRNVRLELKVDGPPERSLYKCVKCNVNFEAENVLEHTTEPCTKSSKFKCTSCSSVFKTRDAKNKHTNIHVVYGDDITFREIAFNAENDEELNEALRSGKPKESLKFRKCPQCELLIKKSDYEKHVTEHNTKFVAKKIISRRSSRILQCTLFKPVNETKKLFTVYKCRLCDASIRLRQNVVTHKCAPTITYPKCSKCFLFILPSLTRKHALLHSMNPKFIRKNISVVEFAIESATYASPINSPVKKRRRYSSDDEDPTGLGVSVSVSKTYDTRKSKGKPYNDILSEDSQDNNEEDQMDETPEASNTYAKHYVKRNAKKRISDTVDEVYEDKDIEPQEIEEESEMKLDVDGWRKELTNKLYQCDKCYLLFLHKNRLLKHIMECDGNVSEDVLICDRCDIVLQPSWISFHEKLHEFVKGNPNENYIFVINITTNGIQTNHKDRWLYKCKLCDIQYLSTRSLEYHFNSNHKQQTYLNCEICDLKFTKISRTRHVRIQHNENKFSTDDLHVEVTRKNTVTEGKIQLRPFVKHQLLDKTCEVVNEEMAEGRSQASKVASEVKCKEAPKINENFYNDCNAIVSLDKFVKQTINHNLYECPKCSKFYVSEYSFLRHMMSTYHQGVGIPCNKCGLLFGIRTLKTHKRVQHKEMNLSLKDFVINKPNENLKVVDGSEENMLDAEDSNGPVNQNEISDVANESNDDTLNSVSQLDVDESQSEQCDDSMAEKYKQLRKELQSPSYGGPIDNRIYKCVECAVYYTNRRTLLLHIVVKKHSNSQYVRCEICGFTFGKGSLGKHKSIQHESLMLSRNDFVITDVFGSQIIDDKNNDESDIPNGSLIESNSTPLLEVKDNEGHEEVELEEMKMFRLYQCILCKVCVEKPQRKLHVCCSDIQKKQCIKCCLTFRNTDALYHRRLHGKHRELSRKNYKIVRFGSRSSKDNRVYKCETCSTHFVNLTTLEWHMDTWNHQTKRVYCENCGLFFGRNCLSRHVYIHHTKLNLNVEQIKIITVSDTDKRKYENKDTSTNDVIDSSVNTATSEHSVMQNSNAVKKLFRCVECDVCFLTRASYYNHIYKHRKLDSTEYIDCDICDLQFLNEALGVHMKSHRENFCLDKLLIEEYQPNSVDSFGVKTYFAKGSVDSKLVSTTTPFDNDEENVLPEKDEQLSVIDSTSDETLKEVVAGEVAVDSNDSSAVNDCADSVILNQSVADVPDINISS